MINRSKQNWPDSEVHSISEEPTAKRELCIEWREIGKQHWNYQAGTRGLSRGMLTRLITGWRDRNPLFEFRIRTFAANVQL